MPIHDWTRVESAIFDDFHHSWISTIKYVLNQGVLTCKYYALVERVLVRPPWDVAERQQNRESSESRNRDHIAIRRASNDKVVAIVEIVSPRCKASRHALHSFIENALEFLDAGIHLLVLDLHPPGPRDPQGMHAAIWSEILDDDFHLPPDKPLTLVSYSAGYVKRAFIEPVAVGDVLPDMPLFLEAESYVLVPLEATYRRAFEAVPQRWREELEPSEP